MIEIGLYIIASMVKLIDETQLFVDTFIYI